jgi:hypothetical protein
MVSGYTKMNLIIRFNCNCLITLLFCFDIPLSRIGFGLSEVGQMMGSDIVTILRTKNNTYTLDDRHVPWSPYKQSPFPEIDKYNNWFLDCAESDDSFFSAVLHRDLDTNDGQDREIKSGISQSVVYAWGYTDAVSYHGPDRGSSEVVFFGASEDPVLPDDSDGELKVVYSPRFVSRGVETQYICQGFDLGEETRHIVEIEAMVRKTVSSIKAHHILVHACGDTPGWYYNLHKDGPMPCGSDREKDRGTSLLGAQGCESLIFAWAVGGTSLILPPAAGIRIGAMATRYIVLETHLDNPNGVHGSTASSLGIKMQTTTALRQYDAASLTIGDPSLSLKVVGDFPRYTPDVHFEATCSSSCTSNFGGDLTVFGSVLHMHSYGREIYTTLSKYNEDSDVVLSMDIVDKRQFWNAQFQLMTPVDFTISQGDSLNTHCVYDTSNTDDTVRFGMSSSNEMCMHFLFVYPAAHLSAGYCGRSTAGYSLCSNTINDANIICKKNPVPDGTKQIPEGLRFGTASNYTTELAMKKKRMLEALSEPPFVKDEDISTINEMACQLYVFKEEYARNIRVSVAIGITVGLFCTCSIFALLIYCITQKFCPSLPLLEDGTQVSNDKNSKSRSSSHGNSTYEMVSLEEDGSADSSSHSV